jgi:hypothetical protein
LNDHLNNFLTCESLTKNILNILEISPKKILFIDDKLPECVDYLSNMIFIGLKNNFEKDCEVAFPVEYMYKSSNKPAEKLHGWGFNYSKVLDDEIKSENENEFNLQKIENKIVNKEYDLIVFGSLTRSRIYLDYVINNYPKEKIIGFIGEDYHQNYYMELINGVKDKLNLFFRELH